MYHKACERAEQYVKIIRFFLFSAFGVPNRGDSIYVFIFCCAVSEPIR